MGTDAPMVEAMVDLTEYERRGDFNAPFESTKKHERVQKESERIREAVRCDVAPLAWEAYVAGEPCPSCGLRIETNNHGTSRAPCTSQRKSASATTLRSPGSKRCTAAVMRCATRSRDR